MKNEKIIGSLICFVIAGLFFVLSLDFPSVGQPKDVGPAFMPKLYAGFLVFFSLILLFQGLKKKLKSTNSEPSYENMVLVACTMILTIGYVFLIPFLGFYLISFIFMALFLKFTRVKSILTILLVPAGSTLFIFIFFQKMLHVPVPTGILFS
ncbi:tripartite tricarboxylate transporter TctB family protein [Bacillus sp. es.034]|uniref:tripartite tricarboxylate transporter TctB family protein n=1 Tax=Bacillus sp. es.034 TaxID=1761763 RepID=UPI000C01BCBD|nr:tripartite tricarboxylate transporter TctB family protein [Bacillus sp. es.034]PFG06791.1 tripartite tricarboxylate transporter TctB family protein [Bacillus sp. es.034]